MAAWIKKYAWDLANYSATLAGWALVTWGLSDLIAAPVWRLSTGLLMLGFVGYKIIAEIALSGIYTLTQSDGG